MNPFQRCRVESELETACSGSLLWTMIVGAKHESRVTLLDPVLNEQNCRRWTKAIKLSIVTGYQPMVIFPRPSSCSYTTPCVNLKLTYARVCVQKQQQQNSAKHVKLHCSVDVESILLFWSPQTPKYISAIQTRAPAPFKISSKVWVSGSFLSGGECNFNLSFIPACFRLS